jgi:tetrahydromethanopterin S-methyltransferase subunit G
MPVVDTLKLKTKLSDSGMPEAQAQVLVEELDEVLSTAIVTQVATRADVVELRAAISNLEERLEQVDKRFEQIDKRLDQVHADMRQIRQWQMGLYVFIALGFLGMIARDLLLK